MSDTDPNLNRGNEEGSDRPLLFVYGSLKRGYALHRELLAQQFVAEAATESSYRLFDLGEYPGLVKVATNGMAVKGEVYRVDFSCLRQLDKIEGVDEGLYQRCRVRLEPPFADHDIWAYLYLLTTNGLRDCGDEWPGD